MSSLCLNIYAEDQPSSLNIFLTMDQFIKTKQAQHAVSRLDIEILYFGPRNNF